MIDLSILVSKVRKLRPSHSKLHSKISLSVGALASPREAASFRGKLLCCFNNNNKTWERRTVICIWGIKTFKDSFLCGNAPRHTCDVLFLELLIAPSVAVDLISISHTESNWITNQLCFVCFVLFVLLNQQNFPPTILEAEKSKSNFW